MAEELKVRLLDANSNVLQPLIKYDSKGNIITDTYLNKNVESKSEIKGSLDIKGEVELSKSCNVKENLLVSNWIFTSIEGEDSTVFNISFLDEE